VAEERWVDKREELYRRIRELENALRHLADIGDNCTLRDVRVYARDALQKSGRQ
jgi:hypothetical protein